MRLRIRNIKVRVDRNSMRRYAARSNGPMDAFARARAVRVAAIARDEVGVLSGATRGTIRVERGPRPSWNVVAGGPAAPHALIHHEGARPHGIDGHPLLTFYWARLGRVVRFPHVNHPGHPGNPFLVRAGIRAGVSSGLKVTR